MSEFIKHVFEPALLLSQYLKVELPTGICLARGDTSFICQVLKENYYLNTYLVFSVLLVQFNTVLTRETLLTWILLHSIGQKYTTNGFSSYKSLF